jgi:tRNA(Ile)-lysidine synthase
LGEWAQVDAEALSGELCVRGRLPGDRFQPLGMQAQKKLQDFLTDAHVPRDQRDAIPLFTSQRGIVWVGGLRIAEWARPLPGKATAYLSFRPA